MSTEKETSRVRAAYDRRDKKGSTDYFMHEGPAHLFRIHERYDLFLAMLAAGGMTDFSSCDILDVGCGRGEFLLQLVNWGASPNRMTGVDVRDNALMRAQECLPSAHFINVNATQLPQPENSMDLVIFNTVFSSILDCGIRQELATEARRVVRPAGRIVVFDMCVNNPRNPDILKLTLGEITDLFPERQISGRRLVLAPPIARRLPSSLLRLFSALPFFKTHRLYVIR